MDSSRVLPEGGEGRSVEAVETEAINHGEVLAPAVSAVSSAVSNEASNDTLGNSLVSDLDDGCKSQQEEEEEDGSEYEYEDEDETAFGGFLVASGTNTTSSAASEQPARIEKDDTSVGNTVPEKKQQWREPSKQAVTMSLRAEKETTGGKRRLASDLYKIMTADTQEAGFSLEPSSEDSMDKWTIKLFQFDEDSNLSKDMSVLGIDAIELEMTFPDAYPFEPPFVRVVRPKFKKQSGFVMNGALCMELLTNDGWNPVNDIESVIVSIRSLLVVGDGRLEAALGVSESQRETILAAKKKKRGEDGNGVGGDEKAAPPPAKLAKTGSYSLAEAKQAYTHLSDYHKKKGWDNSGWWRKKG